MAGTNVLIRVQFTDKRDGEAAVTAIIDHLFATYNGDDSLKVVEGAKVEDVCDELSDSTTDIINNLRNL